MQKAHAVARSLRITRSGLATCVALGCVAVLAPTSATAAPAPSAPPGSIGLRLLEVPADSIDDPRAHLYIVDHLAPGKSLERRIEVTNTTEKPAKVALYAGAASIISGSFQGADGHTANDLSTWTSIKPEAPSVPAGGRLTATVRINVPKDAAPGEQLGVVWAEARSTGVVTQVNRVGIRLYVSIGPGGAPAANFVIDSLTPGRHTDGRPTLVATVHNTGGRALDISGELRLSNGPGGLNAGPFPVSVGSTLAIDTAEPVTIMLDNQVPAGPWDAEIKLRSGLVVATAHAAITFPAPGVVAAAVPTNEDERSWRWLYITIGAVLLAAILTWLLLFLIRRRRRRPPTQAGHRAVHA